MFGGSVFNRGQWTPGQKVVRQEITALWNCSNKSLTIIKVRAGIGLPALFGTEPTLWCEFG